MSDIEHDFSESVEQEQAPVRRYYNGHALPEGRLSPETYAAGAEYERVLRLASAAGAAVGINTWYADIYHAQELSSRVRRAKSLQGEDEVPTGLVALDEAAHADYKTLVDYAYDQNSRYDFAVSEGFDVKAATFAQTLRVGEMVSARNGAQYALSQAEIALEQSMQDIDTETH